MSMRDPYTLKITDNENSSVDLYATSLFGVAGQATTSC